MDASVVAGEGWPPLEFRTRRDRCSAESDRSGACISAPLWRRAALLWPRSYQPFERLTISDHGQHDRNFDQHADHGRKGCAGLETEQADGGGNRQLEEVGGADQAEGPATQCCSPESRFSR